MPKIRNAATAATTDTPATDKPKRTRNTAPKWDGIDGIANRILRDALMAIVDGVTDSPLFVQCGLEVKRVGTGIGVFPSNLKVYRRLCAVARHCDLDVKTANLGDIRMVSVRRKPVTETATEPSATEPSAEPTADTATA